METNHTLGQSLKARATALGLWGVVAQWETLATEPWIETILDVEEQERSRRSLQRRAKAARLANFKPFSDFDWNWPKDINKKLIQRLFSLEFINEPANVIIIGPSGVGKTMLAKNLAHHAVISGYSSLFITASELLNELSACATTAQLHKKIKRFIRPQLLVIDELGYLATSNQHADLFFEVVNRRYQNKPIIITSNKPFAEWNQVFPNTSCVVPLLDRLVHAVEIVSIDAESFRLKDAKKRQEAQSKPSQTNLGTLHG
jgi:DNA replication protein DnaC